jgi:hypothetical protein
MCSIIFAHIVCLNWQYVDCLHSIHFYLQNHDTSRYKHICAHMHQQNIIVWYQLYLIA